MDDFLKEALDIVKAQASVRIMAEDEIISMVRRLSTDIKNVAEGEGSPEEPSADVQSDPRKSIKEKSITCLECGKRQDVQDSYPEASCRTQPRRCRVP